MSKKRKTVDIVWLINEINERIEREPTVEGRNTLALLGDRILLDHGCYAGFNYIYWLDGGYEEWVKAGKPDFPEKEKYITGPSGDRTKIRYYVPHSTLRKQRSAA